MYTSGEDSRTGISSVFSLTLTCTNVSGNILIFFKKTVDNRLIIDYNSGRRQTIILRGVIA